MFRGQSHAREYLAGNRGCYAHDSDPLEGEWCSGFLIGVMCYRGRSHAGEYLAGNRDYYAHDSDPWEGERCSGF